MILADGCFDPVHVGHLQYLQAARMFGEPLMVRLASDQEIRAKQREPFQTHGERALVVGNLKCVDAVVPEDSLARTIIRLCPEVLVKGQEWRTCLPSDVVEACHQTGTRLAFVDTVQRTSTMRLEACANAEDAEALQRFETLWQTQAPAGPWCPVTDYSVEARRACEGRHPELIREVFQPAQVLDYGCGFGHLVLFLLELGVEAWGYDPAEHQALPAVRSRLRDHVHD